MQRLSVLLFAVILSVAVACAPSAQPATTPTQPSLATVAPTQASAATLTLPTPDLSRFKANGLTSGDPKSIDQAEQALTDWARDTSGARAQLGSQADEIFRQVDQAKALAVQANVVQLQARSKPKGMPAPLPPLASKPGGVAQVTSLDTVFGLLMLVTAPDLFNSSQNGQENATPPAVESAQTIQENVRAHVKLQPKITGSSMEIHVETTSRAEKGGVVYEEKASAKISINLCPDGQGNVPFDLMLQESAGVGGIGYQFQLTDHATGHVDEEGNLTGFDHETQTEMSVQAGKGGKSGADSNQYAQVNQQFTMGGLQGKDFSVTGVQTSVPRTSSNVNPEFVQKVAEFGMKLGIMAETFALGEAEKRWQGGYCIAISVAEMGDGAEKIVPTNSETPFTAAVRHKFEGKELTVPVIATLASGKVSVNPSGSKVAAPAAFRYKASDKGGETATVQLESRSRRGIGKLTITFTTRDDAWKVDWLYGTLHLTGTICGLDKPFTLKSEMSLSGLTAVGEFVFAPAGPSGGNWNYAGSHCGFGGCLTVNGSNAYQLEGVADGKPVIRVNPSTGWTVSGLPGGQYIEGIMRIKLEPTTEECRSK